MKHLGLKSLGGEKSWGWKVLGVKSLGGEKSWGWKVLGVKGLGRETSRGEKSRGEKAGVNRHVAEKRWISFWMTINFLGYLIENLIFLPYFRNKKLFTKLSSNDDDECFWKGVGNQSTSQTFQGQNYFYLSSSNPLSNPGNLSISSKLI